MADAMKAIIQLFWEICLLRVGPERVPTAGAFVALVVLANVAVSTATLLVSPASRLSLLDALTWATVATTVMAGGVWLTLQLRSVPGRFLATLTALLGCDTLISLLWLPLAGFAENPNASGGEGDPSGPSGLLWLLQLMMLAGFAWSLAVSGFILQRALEVSLPAGTALAFGLMLATWIFSGAVLAPPTP